MTPAAISGRIRSAWSNARLAEPERPHRGRGTDGGRPRLWVQDRHLPDDAARPHPDPSVLADDLDVTLDDDEEPVLDGAGLHQHRALGVLGLLEHAGDPRQDAPRRLGEQVDVAEQGDALDGQEHALTLDPGPLDAALL